jgi:Domain of unknown function (DUF4328)
LNKQEIVAFRDLARLVERLKVTLAVLLFASLVNAVACWQLIHYLLALPDTTESYQEALISNASIWGLITSGFELLVHLISGFLFLRWTYLTKKNATALGASGLKFSPGWSVGFYFVPLLTLWKPYQALKETFQASHPDFQDDWKSAPVPILLPWWWTLGLIVAFVDQASFRMSFNTEKISRAIDAARLDMLSSLIGLPLVVIVWVLISTMLKWQRAKFNARQVLPAGAAQADAI